MPLPAFDAVMSSSTLAKFQRRDWVSAMRIPAPRAPWLADPRHLAARLADALGPADPHVVYTVCASTTLGTDRWVHELPLALLDALGDLTDADWRVVDAPECVADGVFFLDGRRVRVVGDGAGLLLHGAPRSGRSSKRQCR